MIVVGADHLDGATEALRFALQEARLRQVKLRAVHAVGASYTVLGEELVHPIREGEFAELRRAAEAALDATLEGLASNADGVEIERRIVEGRPHGFSSANQTAPVAIVRTPSRQPE